MAVLLLAVALDLTLGDPPNRWHPVAWIGSLISGGRRLAEGVPPRLLTAYGAALIVAVVAVTLAGSLAVLAVARAMPWPIGFVLEAWLLKLTFSLRGLVSAVWAARDALAAADLGSARAAVARHLVSRPVATLDAGATASAAVESLSENLTDSWVAPLCFFVVGGLPAAFVYRAVNTADAMIGYREGLLGELGWATARLDDLLNLLPSRLGALAVVAGAGLARESATNAWRVWRRDGRLTESPNAGQTMAAMAGALHVTLEKQEHYRLGAGAPPDVVAIDRSMRVFAAAAGLAVVAALVVLRAWR